MKTRKRTICGLVAVLAMLAACTKDDDEGVIVSKTETKDVLLPVAGQKATFTFEANSNWTARTTADWLTIAPTNGNKGTNTITATTTSINRTKAERQATITVTSGSLNKNFTVRQSGNYAMFDQDEYHVGAEGGRVSMTFKSNMGSSDGLSVAYQNLDWLSFDVKEKTRAAEWQGAVTDVIVEPNTQKEKRWATFALVQMQDDEHWVELDTANIVQAGLSSGYESADYAEDGKVSVLQTHTMGHGIPVVLMGDGFTDRDIADSTYWTVMNKTMENLFTEEPVRSMRDYFDIYMVTAVSKHDAVGEDYETAFSCIPDIMSSNIQADDDKVIVYAEKVNRPDSLNMLTVVVLNTNVHNGVTYLYGNEKKTLQFAIAFCPITNHLESEEFREVLIHEAIGHGLAKLADEYGYEKNGKPDDKTLATIKELHKSDWMKNIDTTGESAKVVWWPFIADERFSEEIIGTYEGAYTYTQGVWRPTENSMMNANDCPFNAPSRKVIYDKIRYLGENAPASSFEEFVVFDTAHKPEQWDYTTRASHTAKRKLAPPVIKTR